MGALQKVALGLAAVLRLGIIARRFEGGLGLGELGTGISKVGVGIMDVGIAPFRAVGVGLGEVGTGITGFLGPFRDLINLFTMGQMFPDIAGTGTSPPPAIRPEPRQLGNGVYQVGQSWTFAGAGKLFRYEDRARAKYASMGATYV